MENELDLMIEELILEGFNDIDRDELQALIGQSLNQLVAENGLPKHLSRSVTVADNKPMEAAANLSVNDLGQYIAQQIYAGQQDT